MASLLEIYYSIVWKLAWTLETKLKSLAYDLVSQLGEIVNSEGVKTQEKLEEEILEGNRDYPLRHILKDKKFFDLANPSRMTLMLVIINFSTIISDMETRFYFCCFNISISCIILVI